MIFENLDRIVFAGDSVTDMGSACPVGEWNELGGSYVRVIDNMLAATYPEVFLRITNSGIGGNTSCHLIERFERDVLNLHPQWVSICIGINDVWRQFDSPAMTDWQVMPEQYEKNVEEMVVSAKKICKGVFLMTPYYMEPIAEDPMRARMDEYGTICKKIAQRQGVTLIDLQAMFNEYFKYRHSSFIAADRVHPNQIGATLIAKEFLKHCGYDANHKPQQQ